MPDRAALSYSEAQKTRIETFARLARGMLTHPGEKGRVLEGIVAAALREFLPNRFSIGTGFATNSRNELSRQLDVVIYDHVHNAPIMFDNDVGLFPIESVYAAVEVRTRLRMDKLGEIAASFGRLRDISAHKHYLRYGSREIGPGEHVVEPIRFSDRLTPRTFIFALESDATGPSVLADALTSSIGDTGAHFHGVYVLNANCIISQVAYGGGRMVAQQGDAFRTLCLTVLHCVNSMQMFPAWMDDYANF